MSYLNQGFRPDPFLLVGVGDSNTEGGFGGTTWIEQLITQYTGQWDFVDVGVTSATLVTMVTNFNTTAGRRYFSPARQKNICVIFGGTNDINGGANAATCSSRLAALVTAVRAAQPGYQIVTVTVPAAAVFDAGEETIRGTFNTTTTTNAANAYGDVIVPLGATAGFQPADTGGANYTDGTHLSTAGSLTLKNMILAAIASLRGRPIPGFANVQIRAGRANFTDEVALSASQTYPDITRAQLLKTAAGTTVGGRVIWDTFATVWDILPVSGIKTIDLATLAIFPHYIDPDGSFTSIRGCCVYGGAGDAYSLNIRYTGGSAAPEGSVTAGIGSIHALSTNGILRHKRSGAGNTGWEVLGSDQFITNSPVTGATVVANDNGYNQTFNLTPAGTLANLTLTFPTNTNSINGQIVTIHITQAITTLTLQSTGATFVNTLAAFTANDCIAFKKFGTTWVRMT